MNAKEVYLKAIALGIEVPCDIPDAEIERVYNGVGPEWMAGWMRKCLDFFFEVFLPAVWKHDYRYAYGDGTLKDFMDANRELGENCRICADAKYGWYNPLRYAAHWVGDKFAKVCDISGLPAYLQAIEETKQHNNSKKQGGEKWNTATEHQRLVRGKARERAQSLLSMLLMNPEA